jgi:hypothetical protein
MAAPDKLAFDPHDLIVVHRGGNRQSPVIRETVELAGEIDGLEQDGFPLSAVPLCGHPEPNI